MGAYVRAGETLNDSMTGAGRNVTGYAPVTGYAGSTGASSYGMSGPDDVAGGNDAVTPSDSGGGFFEDVGNVFSWGRDVIDTGQDVLETAQDIQHRFGGSGEGTVIMPSNDPNATASPGNADGANDQGGEKTDEGISTGTKVAIGAAVAVALYMIFK